MSKSDQLALPLMLIRPGTLADMFDLHTIERQCKTCDTGRLGLVSFAAWGCTAWVAERGGQVVGVAWIRERRGGTQLEIVSLAVRANARGKGVGASLLARVEEIAKQRHSTPVLYVCRDNPGAQALYDRLGYKAVGGRGAMIRMHKPQEGER